MSHGRWRSSAFALGLLCAAALPVEARGDEASLCVHVVRDRIVMGDSFDRRPTVWRPQRNRLVHVTVGSTWRDSTVTDSLGDARFPGLPPGTARVWCNDILDLGNREETVAGGTVVLRPHVATMDTLWLRCQITGIYR